MRARVTTMGYFDGGRTYVLRWPRVRARAGRLRDVLYTVLLALLCLKLHEFDQSPRVRA